MTSTGPTTIIQLFHNERILRDAPAGASWADEYGLVTVDNRGYGVFETDMSKPLFGMATLQSAAVGVAVPAVNIAGMTQDPVTLRYLIPVYGDVGGVYAVRIMGNFEGK
jgi:hypothetical protein